MVETYIYLKKYNWEVLNKKVNLIWFSFTLTVHKQYKFFELKIRF